MFVKSMVSEHFLKLSADAEFLRIRNLFMVYFLRIVQFFMN